jgi:outer membrane immunogenic protein
LWRPVGPACYVNGGVGYGLNNLDHFAASTSGAKRDETSGGRGRLGRFGGGCDYQFSPASGWGNWVVGAFADYDFMDLHGDFGDVTRETSAPQKEKWAAR